LIDYLSKHPKEVVGYAIHLLKGSRAAFPPGMMEAVDTMIVRAVARSLAWPLKRTGSRSIVPLPHGPSELNSVPDVAALLFFGGRTRTTELVDLENNVTQSAAKIDAHIDKMATFYRSKDQSVKLGWEGLPRANPRVQYPTLNLSTIVYKNESLTEVNETTVESWSPQVYSIPVFSMVDMLGDEMAQEIVKGTPFETTTWMAVKSGTSSAPFLEWLIRGEWWAMERGIRVLG
jgi:hypothetical protein